MSHDKLQIEDHTHASSGFSPSINVKSVSPDFQFGTTGINIKSSSSNNGVEIKGSQKESTESIPIHYLQASIIAQYFVTEAQRKRLVDAINENAHNVQNGLNYVKFAHTQEEIIQGKLFLTVIFLSQFWEDLVNFLDAYTDLEVRMPLVYCIHERGYNLSQFQVIVADKLGLIEAAEFNLIEQVRTIQNVVQRNALLMVIEIRQNNRPTSSAVLQAMIDKM